MTGWTWDQVRDGLDLPRVEALRRAWKDNPPLVICMRLAAESMGVEFLGSKLSSDRAPEPELLDANPDALLGMLGQAEPIRYVPPLKGLPVGEPSKRKRRPRRPTLQ